MSLELKPLFVLKWGRKMISHIHEATVLVLTQPISPYMHNTLIPRTVSNRVTPKSLVKNATIMPTYLKTVF